MINHVLALHFNFREPARFVKGLSREVVDVGKKILRPLNKVQQKAVFR